MITHSEQETKKLASEFAATLKGGEIVFLQGDLGSGKSTFVRGIAEHFGYTDPVRSPTFTLVNRHVIDHKQIKEILHLDLYRIEEATELETLALSEELGKPQTISFIEWPSDALEHYGIIPTSTIQFKTNGTQHEIDL